MGVRIIAKKKILVVGASGFIGKHFVLSCSDDELSMMYRNPSFLDFISEHRVTGECLPCDLTNADAVAAHLSKHNDFDVCVYLAGNTDPQRSAKEPLMDCQSNVLGLLHVLEHLRCKKFIYFSSGAVYHGLSGAVGPHSPLDPVLPYAISKYACEQYVKHYASKGSLGSFVIVRFFGAFGPYEPERKITTKLIKTLQSGETEYTIYGDGSNLIDLMYVDDTVLGIRAIINSDVSDVVVDFGRGSPVTILELVDTVADSFDTSVTVHKEGVSAEAIQFTMSNKEFETLFGFTFTVPLEEGICKLKDFMS